MKDIIETWDWSEHPFAPQQWTALERRVVLVDSLHSAMASSARSAAGVSLTLAVERGAVAVCVEPPGVLVTWADGKSPRWIPALRIERQADLGPQALDALFRVKAPIRALVLSPREEIDLDPSTCPDCGRNDAFAVGDDGATPFCPDCDGADGDGVEMCSSAILDPCASAERQPGVNLVIVQGPSGPDAWPMHPDWVRRIRNDCEEAGVAFIFASWGDWQNGSTVDRPLQEQDPAAERVVLRNGRVLSVHGVEAETTPDERASWHTLGATIMARVGAERSGRLLDGVEHMAMPEEM